MNSSYLPAQSVRQGYPDEITRLHVPYCKPRVYDVANMSKSTARLVGPARYEDFEILQETFLQLAAEPDASVRTTDRGTGLFVEIDRVYADMDFLAWPPLSISLTGLIKTVQAGHTLHVRYRETAHNPSVRQAHLDHAYAFRSEDGDLIEFGHSIEAYPQLTEQRQLPATDAHMDQAEAGRRLLAANMTGSLETTAGDCVVLFDRMNQFL